ncbi:MAG TPA: von Willebrand factor type A domain-containing protein [Bacteroidales bacterium]|nr:von Willebrand factor type A domain-containing protein [Bacteroidales bacterium]
MKKFLVFFSILTVGIFLLSFTMVRVITGKVTDKSGNPLPGVVVKAFPSETNDSVVTRADGSYMIETGDKAKKLVFTFMKRVVVEEVIGNRTIIDVTIPKEPVATSRKDVMMMEAQSMPAVVVGYGVSKSTMPINRYNGNFNTEGYASVNENGFRAVSANPLSTFSIDVDNASYSNIRRFINNGQLPPPDAVRIEEMINYFRYSYPEPSGEYPFSLYTELSTCPWNRDHQLLHLGLRAKDIDKSSLPPANLVFLIDVSGSMNSPNKLPLLKSAFALLVNELRSNDRVAIVVYAGAAGLVLESTPGNRKGEILEAINNLEAGGSTAGGEGLKLAYHEAEKSFIDGGNNRIILATDGDFNVGESSNGGMERLVEEKRSLGVYMTVLGFGMGNIKDDKMEIIADKGNGNYSYIDNLQEARKVLVSEFGGTLFTIAKDVKFQVEFNPAKVKSYRLVGYENRILNEEDFNDDTKDAGEMGAGHNVTALYEIVPAGSDEDIPSIDPLKYQKSTEKTKNDYSGEYLTVKIRYKTPDTEISKLMEKSVKGYVMDPAEASDNLKFAAAVAEFGMLLRNSEFAGSSTFDNAASLARSSRGFDEDGFRSELIRLINTARDMKLTSNREDQLE